MNAEERAIIDYLKGWPNVFVSCKEIARKVRGRNRYDENRGWAVPILARMVQEGVIDTDHLGCFRLKVADPKNKRGQKHISPQFLRILKNSGQNFESIEIDDDSGETLAYTKAPPSLSTAPVPPGTPMPPEEDKSV